MHTDSPESSAAEMADEQPSIGLRRRLIGAGLIGLAGSLVPRVAAHASSTTPDDTAAATTTTAPPKRPAGDDVQLLDFAQSVELAAVALYDITLAAGALSDTTLAVVTQVHQAHVSYAQSLNALLGRQASGTALADVIDAFSDAFGGSEDEFLAAAYTFEDTAVATHTELLGQVLGTDGAQLIASILIIEARQALVFADLSGETDLDALIFTDAKAIEPGKG